MRSPALLFLALTLAGGSCTDLTDLLYVDINQIPDAEVMAPYGTDICVYGLARVKCISSPGTGATYQWYLNGDMIAGATIEVYDTSVSGDYHVVVTGPNVFKYKCANYTYCRLRLDQNTEYGSISVYPNPAHDNFTVSLNTVSVSGDAFVQVSDITGRIVYSNNTVIMSGQLNDVVSLGNDVVNGMYVVTVTSGAETWNTRLMIVK